MTEKSNVSLDELVLLVARKGTTARSVIQLDATLREAGVETAAAVQSGNELRRHLERLRSYVQTSNPRFDDERQSVLNRWPLARNEPVMRATVPGLLPPQPRFTPTWAAEPAPKWSVLVDETGMQFDAVGARRGDPGRVVAVAVPSTTSLDALAKSFHSVSLSSATVAETVRHLLAKPVAIFGISSNLAPYRHVRKGDLWGDVVSMVVDHVCRSIPALPNNAPVEVNVLVENRGEVIAGLRSEWAATIMQGIRARNPDRAKWLRLIVKVVKKGSHALLGYADAVAYVFGQPDWRRLLLESGLLDTCLFESEEQEFGVEQLALEMEEAIARGDAVSASVWRALVASSNHARASSALGLLAERAAREPQVLRALLSDVEAHLDSKAIDLELLTAQSRWLHGVSCLESSEVDSESKAHLDWSVPSDIRLAWLVAELQHRNHVGDADAGELTRAVASLAANEKLVQARPALCAHADLVLAVQATNRFDFLGNLERVQRWVGERPEIWPTLRYRGRARSQLGQLRAFINDLPEAIEWFERALRDFRDEPDPSVTAHELLQTGAYLAIASMDSVASDVTDAVCRARVFDVISGADETPASTVERLALSSAPADKYAHHLLLRWLVTRGDSELGDRYLGFAEDWETGVGHPWPLVDAYRAILLAERDESPGERVLAASAIDRAVDAARSPRWGATVNVIGETLAAVRASLDLGSGPDAARLDALARELPYATGRLAIIGSDAALDARELLARVLPFNFR